MRAYPVLRIEFMPGDSIEGAAAESCRLAGLLSVIVMFKFNGVECMAAPGGDPAELVRSYQSAPKHPGVIACARRRQV